MTYSFNIKAAGKAEAKKAVAVKFDEVVGYQPIHARDRAVVLATAGAVIDTLTDDANKDITVSCNGSLGWSGAESPDTATITTASVGCTAHHAPR